MVEAAAKMMTQIQVAETGILKESQQVDQAVVDQAVKEEQEEAAMTTTMMMKMDSARQVHGHVGQVDTYTLLVTL